MGKGDKKSKRGKIILGSYGVSRPRKKISGKLVITPSELKAETLEIKQKVKTPEPKTKAAEPKSKAIKKPKSSEFPEVSGTEDESGNQ